MHKVDEKIIKEYKGALYNQAFGNNNEPMKQFKERYPDIARFFNGMYRKRTELMKDCDIMKDLKLPIYWITLTFNNDKDKNKIESKRKEAERMLSDLCLLYVIVEEYGEDNNRYHIHGFITFKLGYGFQDFIEWHSRQKIELLEGWKIKKKVRYLTNYMCKEIPRLRRSKMLCKMRNFAKGRQRLRRCFPITYREELHNCFANVAFPEL